MRSRDDVYLAITALVNFIAACYALVFSPAEVEMGALVRILYFHIPPALVWYLTASISVFTAILFIMRQCQKYDTFSESAALLGLIYGGITLVGGSIWANATWGVYWNWDPRETTSLILWLAYIGYFLLRMSVENPERRASVSAVYNILAFLTTPLSYLSFILWPSLHPRLGSGKEIGLTASMMDALLLNMLAALLLYIWLLKKTYEVRMKREEVSLKLLKGDRAAS